MVTAMAIGKKTTLVTVCCLIRLSSLVSILGLCGSTVSALSLFTSAAQTLGRRSAIAAIVSPAFLLASDSAPSAPSSPSSSPPVSPPFIADPNLRAITTIRIDSPSGRNAGLGLELRDVSIGTPPRVVAAVRSVRRGGEADRAGARPGMVLLDYADAADAAGRIGGGDPRRPVEIRLYDLASGGDAVGDLGEGIVSSEDALELAVRISGSSGGDVDGAVSQGGSSAPSEGLVIETVRNAGGKCGIKSRRFDLMQVRYDARIGGRSGAIYDSSEFRGTGQPYAFMLGNNDVIKGVDLGTYGMCPGEVRELTIPPELGYRNGSKLFKIPPNSPLFWSVELVELNSVKEGMNDDPRDD